MPEQAPILGVYLSETADLDALYGTALRRCASDVVLRHPGEISDPAKVRFAICWQPGADAFAPYPNLGLAMSVAAGVDALLAHPGLPDHVAVARVRDPHQADLMAGYAVHEVLHHERRFADMARNAAAAHWAPLAMRAPASVQVAVLGHGTMGRAVVGGLRAVGFAVRVACRSAPQDQLPGVSYLSGPDAVLRAAEGADYLVNVLPLTAETENLLDGDLFARLSPGAVLVQIGRGEHLCEADMMAALDAGQLAAATLDVFREEPLPPSHRFWQDARLRITPHVASDSLPEVVARQVIDTARALRGGQPMAYAVDRARGY
ncbi:NAD(P)-dependent oxidoreductase [Salipiger sp. 1_MG-2023]|uniref:NAD(P)-dependent oxidoreductase n=1 Tax=Salipiger sp. 1_MG-2023 TaxID=3062665 RepID=UPI0026E3A08E|nr:NAD(P)-dependent oxidoreductase [Salipiger sp. 1_MG-2023]MDO6585233.1 NAD(P)-dependent oxidoreductase [Salipiger sp. 1_MG-2023]